MLATFPAKKIITTNIEIIDDNDIKVPFLLAPPAIPHHVDGTVPMPKQSPPHPLPPLHVSALCSSAGEGREMLMMTMTIQEAMTTLIISNPISPTPNNQP
jgi:hypothetical protein